MTRLWQACLALAFVAVAAAGGVLGIVALAVPDAFRRDWDEILWLTLPPFWLLVAVWFGRTAGRRALLALAAAGAATAVALAAGAVFAASGHGYLRPGWGAPAGLTAFRLMALPAGLTLAAGLLVALNWWQWRQDRLADDEDAG